MAVKLSTSDDTLDETHEINVTPFIDVMLVLLIIFMVAAPLSTVDINVDLPASTAQASQRPDKPIFVSIKPDLTLAIGDSQVARDSLGAAIDAASGGDKQQRVFLRGDKSISYGSVMDIMNLLRKAGYLKIALVGLDASQAPPEKAPGPAAAP
ncbi:TonB system transport protein ExbD [Methylovirgula ligni]|uniref:Biopolymer transport protein ExbD n=1 Tax=Methylovirgula ligni TaxID=569860 RepID=A0A3D9YXD1_9HYPH|nr:TonB system transport protein ExbD [Methylovirgula ligni]QAY94781.1 TonB system transport protein ExbD [Methylovirgula ligni]REF87317.1 outer membrane transport energization protein ExbD [Methylovirgula ligni]